jgi:hypothetical protein
MLEPLGIEHIRVDPDPDSRLQADNSSHRPLPCLASPSRPGRLTWLRAAGAPGSNLARGVTRLGSHSTAILNKLPPSTIRSC